MGKRCLALLVDICSLIGLLTLLTGGLRIKRPPIDLMWYGRWLLPLAICLACRIQVGSVTTRYLARFNAWFEQRTPRQLTTYTLAAIAFFLGGHALVITLRHMAFRTGMDLAIYGNACRGALFSTMKGDVWLFADHFEPVLILFTPLCRATSPVFVLLTAQTLAYGIGAFGMYRLAQVEGWAKLHCSLIAVGYITFYPLVTTVYYDFHL